MSLGSYLCLHLRALRVQMTGGDCLYKFCIEVDRVL